MHYLSSVLFLLRHRFAHVTFGAATLLDVVGAEQLRSMTLALYLAAFLVDHVGA